MQREERVDGDSEMTNGCCRLVLLVSLLLVGCASKLTVTKTDTGLVVTCTRGARCESGDILVDSKFEPLKGMLSIGPKLK